jgi:hypothetical protein
LADLAYCGIKIVNEHKITCNSGTVWHFFHAVNESLTDIRAAIDTWESHIAVATLVQECASHYLTSVGKVEIDIQGLKSSQTIQSSVAVCSWQVDDIVEPILYQCWSGNIMPRAKEYNEYLVKVGLENVSIDMIIEKVVSQVAIKLVDIYLYTILHTDSTVTVMDESSPLFVFITLYTKSTMSIP